jgi:hypothetical protein
MDWSRSRRIIPSTNTTTDIWNTHVSQRGIPRLYAYHGNRHTLARLLRIPLEILRSL